MVKQLIHFHIPKLYKIKYIIYTCDSSNMSPSLQDFIWEALLVTHSLNSEI